MGVQGLWHLLQPCARPTQLESLEGRRLAIDSSIWLYHFQMAMRDKEGRTLSNAHILGFLWRILKLIHYGIRPIFVFDGGAPVMKRQTLVGRRQRKAGAKDDHRRIAEKLLNAKLREAAIAHVAGAGAGGGGGGSSSTLQAKQQGESFPEDHGLGQNTVYFDDLNTANGGMSTTGHESSSNNDSAWMDVTDDGAVSLVPGKNNDDKVDDSEAQNKKKRNDWHKDPYALPALERDINTMTASTSTAAKNARGGGKRQDVRFATEGELRALLSSIGPTDLDLDSEFFRSLPSELQYELVGDMRAASRGTSYKRLQAMLSQSPTPIDFSRAQIAGLKTRNELTQKVLEVTDEIGDAHIKVPIRVAGARNREYVLVRNNGKEGGFALGVRDSGTTSEKAIAIDEDTASASTTDDDLERRTTDEEVELVEVPIEASPEKDKRARESIPLEFLNANPNDPVERKRVARELLERRARELAKEKAREKGMTFEAEEMEEQLRKAREARIVSKQGRGLKAGSANETSLFRRKAPGQPNDLTIDLEGTEEEDEEEDWEETLNQYEAADLGRALDESERSILTDGGDVMEKVADEEEAKDKGGELELELEEVPTHAFEAHDYSRFYGKHESSAKIAAAEEEQTPPSWITGGKNSLTIPPSKVLSTARRMAKKTSNAYPALKSTKAFKARKAVKATKATRAIDLMTSSKSTKGGPALAFRLQDREGDLERLDPRLTMRRPWEQEAEMETNGEEAEIADDVEDADADTFRSSQSSSLITTDDPIIKWDPKHTRVISISDSEASQHHTTDPAIVIEDSGPETEIVTMRSEQNNLRDGGGNEVKVIDYRDKTLEKPFEPIGQIEKGTESASTVDGEPDEFVLPSSTSESKAKVDSSTQKRKDEETYLLTSNEKEITIPPLQTQLSSKESLTEPSGASSEPSSPLGAARRAESARLSLPLLEVEDELQEATDNKVSFDNLSSMVDEVGGYPRLDLERKEEQEESPPLNSLSKAEKGAVVDGRDSEDEHSDYSNRGFDGNQSDSSSSSSPQPQVVVLGPDGFPLPSSEELAAMDAEDEAELGEMANDQDEFISFLSRAKGQGLNQIRKEVEDEVNKLRSEHATTRRTEGEVTLQMAKEIQFMLRLFGLPYITAPMEAEAQCAELMALKLADGIITDDSDVFLFGGTFIYKNMFNNKKYVECYKLSDLQHDLGMDRTKLVQLAYLLGSDYTEGLEGVGPVLAMEILSHFPGDDGLVKFREWWLKVQMGKDTTKDTYDSTLKRLKKTLRNKVHLDLNWPDANVIDAYFEPTVDSSKESFQWGLPDLDSLRSFFKEYLRWDQEKTDHYLIPAIEAQNRRSKRNGTQSTLDRANFFDLSAGEGVYAGKKKTGYNSTRLQQIVNSYRLSNSRKDSSGKEGKKGKSAEGQVDVVTLSDEEEEEEVIVPEELLGKEMGKRSRPIVGKRRIDSAGGSHHEEIDNLEKGKRKPSQKRRKKSQTISRNQSEDVHEQEWIPSKPKKQGKARQRQKEAGGTSLSQARNMSLDSIAALPPSRASTRTQRSSLQTRPSITLSDDDSSLSEQE